MEADCKGILFTAFEPSGDEHAAPVICALRKRLPDVPIWALGGPRMAEAGAELIECTVDDATMLAGSFAKIGEQLRLRRVVKNWLADHKIAAHIPTDSPAANWALCKMVKRTQPTAKVIHLVAPQVWAWASWRVKRLHKWSDGVLCLLPFEPSWFSKRGVEARFIGHPVFDHSMDDESLRWDAVSYPAGQPKVAMLPGSRRGEVNRNWPVMRRVAEQLADRYDDIQVIVVAADESFTQSLRTDHPAIRVVVGSPDAVLCWSDVVLSVSGTATLHVARHGKPMAIAYRISPWSWYLAGRWLINTRTFTLPNLIAADGPARTNERHIVREFVPWLGGTEAVEPITRELVSLIENDEKRLLQLDALKGAVELFDGRNAGEEAAEAIVQIIN